MPFPVAGLLSKETIEAHHDRSQMMRIQRSEQRDFSNPDVFICELNEVWGSGVKFISSKTWVIVGCCSLGERILVSPKRERESVMGRCFREDYLKKGEERRFC